VSVDRRNYGRLFGAYLLASLGGGVAVVALSLFAFTLAPDEQEAAAIIGAALSIKTLAYVVGAPVAAAFLGTVPRRPLLAVLDLVRAGAILLLLWVDAVWQVLALIGVFTLASAAFTPAYQTSVSGLLPDPKAYARAVARSRVAGELDGLASPLLAAALLAALSVKGVFVVAMAAFLISAALIATTRLAAAAPAEDPFRRLGAGFGALIRTPALRGLAPMAFAAGAGAAAVMVETVPIVRGRFGLGDQEAALALAVFGGGALVGAVALPRLLSALGPRTLMLAGGVVSCAGLVGAMAIDYFATLLALWGAIGAGATLAQAPALALIAQETAPEDKQIVYAANFSLTTAAAGLCFALAGALGGTSSLGDATAALALLAGAATLCAALLWRLASPGASRADAGDPPR
jgi:MFS family permease